MSSVDDYHTRLKIKKQKLDSEYESNMMNLILKGFKTTGIAIVVWFWGYLGMSVAWIFVFLFFHIVSGEVNKQIKSKRKYALQAMCSEKEAILSRVDNKQSWIYFPEIERAEWMNKMLKQMWPMIAEYAQHLIQTTIQDCIQAYMPSNLGEFRFSTVDIGDIPIRVEGVKVYIDSSKKDEIVLDAQVKYAGDANIKGEVKGFTFGIKTLRINGKLRVIMNPLINEIPIIGGLSVFFLNNPDLDFDMSAAANILDFPLIKSTIKDIVSKVIADLMVLPRRMPIVLHERACASSIRYPPPQGVVVIHLLEGKDLKKADINLIGKGKSDPYCVVTIGNQSMRSKVVESSLNPLWDQFFQGVVDQKHGQSIDIRVYDHDKGSNNDDHLGNASLDIDMIADKGSVDMWIKLMNVDTGSIHIRALWMASSTDMSDFTPIESPIQSLIPFTSILLVVVENAQKIPEDWYKGKKKSLFVRLKMEEVERVTTVKETNEKISWEENFNFLLIDPQNQKANLQLVQKNGTKEVILGSVQVPISSVLLSKEFSFFKELEMPEVNKDFKLNIRFVLRVLKSEIPLKQWSEFSGMAAITFGSLMGPSFFSQDSTSDKSSPKTEEPSSEENDGKRVVIGNVDFTMKQTDPPPKEQYPYDSSHPPPSIDIEKEAFEQSKVTPGYEEPMVNELRNDQEMKEALLNHQEEKKEPSLYFDSNPPAKLDNFETPKESISTFHQPEPQPSNNPFGQIELTLRYSSAKSSLVLVVHRCRNLIPCDKDRLADPYVRIYLLPDRSSDSKKKTKLAKNNLNPIFDESFEWILGNMELPFRTLEVGVKNDVGMFSKSRTHMGTVFIELGSLGDLSQGRTLWFDLEENKH